MRSKYDSTLIAVREKYNVDRLPSTLRRAALMNLQSEYAYMRKGYAVPFFFLGQLSLTIE